MQATSTPKSPTSVRPVRAVAWGLVVVVGAIAGAACATTSDVHEHGDATPARDYLPLAIGNSWSYAAEPAASGAALEVVTVERRDADGFFVDSRGARLAPRSDGVTDGDRYLLVDPLVEGKSWTAKPKNQPLERYRVTEAGVQLTVPAGTFSGCVVVEGVQVIPSPEPGRSAFLRTTWSYAPRVGLIKLVREVVVGDQARDRAALSLTAFALEGGAPRAP